MATKATKPKKKASKRKTITARNRVPPRLFLPRQQTPQEEIDIAFDSSLARAKKLLALGQDDFETDGIIDRQLSRVTRLCAFNDPEILFSDGSLRLGSQIASAFTTGDELTPEQEAARRKAVSHFLNRLKDWGADIGKILTPTEPLSYPFSSPLAPCVERLDKSLFDHFVSLGAETRELPPLSAVAWAGILASLCEFRSPEHIPDPMKDRIDWMTQMCEQDPIFPPGCPSKEFIRSWLATARSVVDSGMHPLSAGDVYAEMKALPEQLDQILIEAAVRQNVSQKSTNTARL